MRCGDCKYLRSNLLGRSVPGRLAGRLDGLDIEGTNKSGFDLCVRIKHGGDEEAFLIDEKAGHLDDDKAVVIDSPDGGSAELQVREDFGCVEFQEKKK